MTRTNICPRCNTPVVRPMLILAGVEIFAEATCLCDDCEAKREAQEKAEWAEIAANVQWKRRLPPKYHSATVEQVPPQFRPALTWKRTGHARGIGMTGPVGIGKSMAMALTLQQRVSFRWVTGTALREIAIDASTADGEARAEARAKWQRYLECRTLAIDDLDKAKFTEAWCSKLFELLEHRTGNNLPVFWTANHGPGQLAAHISKQSGDAFAGDAIERRLCQGALILPQP